MEDFFISKDSDIILCAEEVCKLIANLRCTDKYSDVSRPMSLWPKDVSSSTIVGVISPPIQPSPPSVSTSQVLYGKNEEEEVRMIASSRRNQSRLLFNFRGKRQI